MSKTDMNLSLDTISICSDLSSDTLRDMKMLELEAELGDDQEKIDEVWEALDDVEIAKAELEKAEEALVDAKAIWDTEKDKVSKFKRNVMPPRSLQHAKAIYEEAKSKAKIRTQRLKHCQGILERKKVMADSLGLKLNLAVPDHISVPSTAGMSQSV